MRLHHVSLEVAAAEREPLAAFFELLGFTRVAPPPTLVDRALWMQDAEGAQVHLLFADDAVAPPRGHVAVVVGDYEQTLERLLAAGFGSEPRQRHWDSPRCYVGAPGGHRVELMAFPPG